MVKLRTSWSLLTQACNFLPHIPSLKKQNVTYVSQLTFFPGQSWALPGKSWSCNQMHREHIRACLGLLGLHWQHLNLQAPAIPLNSTGCKLMLCSLLCGRWDHKSARVMAPHQLAEFISSVSYTIPSCGTALAAQLPAHDPCSWENISKNSFKDCVRGLQTLISSILSNLCMASHPFWLRIRGNSSSSQIRAPGEWILVQGLGGCQILSKSNKELSA